MKLPILASVIIFVSLLTGLIKKSTKEAKKAEKESQHGKSTDFKR